jgi:hypothetical protein
VGGVGKARPCRLQQRVDSSLAQILPVLAECRDKGPCAHHGPAAFAGGDGDRGGKGSAWALRRFDGTRLPASGDKHGRGGTHLLVTGRSHVGGQVEGQLQ